MIGSSLASFGASCSVWQESIFVLVLHIIRSLMDKERVNQCMETFLHCFANVVPSKWFDWLHLAEYWYNTTWHSAINRSPFEALYG
jgi:hypothetical protein